jgi:hypothetical protein
VKHDADLARERQHDPEKRNPVSEKIMLNLSIGARCTIRLA